MQKCPGLLGLTKNFTNIRVPKIHKRRTLTENTKTKKKPKPKTKKTPKPKKIALTENKRKIDESLLVKNLKESHSDQKTLGLNPKFKGFSEFYENSKGVPFRLLVSNPVPFRT